MKHYHVIKATSLGWDETATYMRVSLYSPRFKSRKTIRCNQDELSTEAAIRYLKSINFDIEGLCCSFDDKFDLIVCNTFETFK